VPERCGAHPRGPGGCAHDASPAVASWP
jgi:hypothetical protein